MTEMPPLGVRLERLSARHLDAVAAVGRDPEVQRFAWVPSPWEDGFERRWVERYERGNGDGSCAGFAIVADGRFLGMAMLVTIDREGREAEAGYIVAPEARRRGVAVAALRLLSEWAFDELSLERLELRIATENEPSLRVAERAGFVHEGVLRSVHFRAGQRVDLAVYSQLASERDAGPSA